MQKLLHELVMYFIYYIEEIDVSEKNLCFSFGI